MKKKVITIFSIILILFLLSIIIPVRKGKIWVNDDPIAEVGHSEMCYYNIYGGTFTLYDILLKFKQ